MVIRDNVTISFHEVMNVQFQFPCETTVQKYASEGTSFDFPKMKRCRNPRCLIHTPPRKHGFYWRFILNHEGVFRIAIRRYYCPYCGVTFSFLPSFCFSYYQYSSDLISEILVTRFISERSYNDTLKAVQQSYPDLDLGLSHVKLYTKRFSINLPWIEVVLRDTSNCTLPPAELGHQKRARKVLDAVLAGCENIQHLAKVFLEQCHRSFLSPRSNTMVG